MSQRRWSWVRATGLGRQVLIEIENGRSDLDSDQVRTRQSMMPQAASGWLVLFALALVSQVLGQGLIAYAFAHLPASSKREIAGCAAALTPPPLEAEAQLP